MIVQKDESMIPIPASHHAVILIYPGFLAVTFHELESIMMPFGR